jgi:hypothetical protein
MDRSIIIFEVEMAGLSAGGLLPRISEKSVNKKSTKILIIFEID